MFRLLALVVLVLLGSAAYSQTAANHEPTSATDGEVKLHNAKKSRFHKATRARKDERITDSSKDTRTKASVRETERHGKSVKKSRGSKRMNGEARVFRKHGHSTTSSTTKKSKARRSLGRSVE